MDDDNVDGILLFMMFASANVDALKGISDLLGKWAQRKPLVSCILSPPGIWGKQIKALEQSGSLINYPTPERAAGYLYGNSEESPGQSRCRWGVLHQHCSETTRL